MTLMRKILVSGAGIAALATAAPSAAQYAYGAPYGYAYGYNANVTAVAAQQCTAAVQNRLNRRTGVGGIVGALLGQSTTGRVLSITRVVPRENSVRVRGLATSGRMAGYGPYGVGAYGGLAYSYQPDLSFSCSVDYRGFVRDVDIVRR